MSVSIVYALLSSTYEFDAGVTVEGLNLHLYDWISDTQEPTTLVTFVEFGSMLAGTSAYSENLVLKNSGTFDFTLTFDDTLPVEIGIITWEIEWYKDVGTYCMLEWRNWETAILGGTDYIPGHVGNPITPGQLIGQRPEAPVENDVGRIRLCIEILSDSPLGQTHTFGVSVTGTEA